MIHYNNYDQPFQPNLPFALYYAENATHFVFSSFINSSQNKLVYKLKVCGKNSELEQNYKNLKQ